MAKVLLIDDSNLDRKIACDILRHGGFEVAQAADGRAGLRLLFEYRPDVVLLDVMMPVLDGWSVCERIREMSDVPIIMVTSLNREEEMVRGLDLGADDFITKPISPGAMLARLKAVLRRAHAPQPPQPAAFVYDDGTVLIDEARHEVRLGDELLTLTPTEFRLLAALAAAPGRVHAYAGLLTEVWGQEYADDIDFLRVYVWRLRKKLETHPAGRSLIANERGFGYRFIPARERTAGGP